MKTQTRFVLGLMTAMVLWAGLGLVLCYKKGIFGNKQEMYPTIILPGFARSNDRSTYNIYTRYLIVATGKDSLKENFHPQIIFGKHWKTKLLALVDTNKSDTIVKSSTWLNKLPEGTQFVHIYKQVRFYDENVKPQEHPLIREEKWTYHVK